VQKEKPLAEGIPSEKSPLPYASAFPQRGFLVFRNISEYAKPKTTIVVILMA
jgi:hypothetical protein